MSKSELPETRIETFTEISNNAAEKDVADPHDVGDRVVVDYSDVLEAAEDGGGLSRGFSEGRDSASGRGTSPDGVALERHRAQHGTVWTVVDSWVRHTTEAGQTANHHVYERQYQVVPAQQDSDDPESKWCFEADRLLDPEDFDGTAGFYYDTDDHTVRMLVTLPDREDFPRECACCGSNKAIDHYNDLSSRGGLDCAVCGYRIREYGR